MGAKKKVLQVLDMNSNTITGLPAPSANSDAATKAYVDANAAPVTSVNGQTDAVMLDASDIAINDTDNHFTTDTVQGAIEQLFTSANNGKTSIAGVIGSPAASSDTFTQLKDYIQTTKDAMATLINRAEGSANPTANSMAVLNDKLPPIRAFKSMTKLRKNANSIQTITLNTTVTADKLVISPLRLEDDGATTPFSTSFSNADSSDFISNSNISFANDNMEIAVKASTADFTNITSHTSGTEYAATLDISAYNDVRINSTASGQVAFDYLPTGQVARANGDIPGMSSVGDFSVVIEIGLGTDNNDVRMAVSFAGTGATNSYKAWNGTTWQTLSDVTDATEFATKGMTQTMLNSMTVSTWDSIRTSDTIRFAYYINRPSFSASTSLDYLYIGGFLKGTLKPANASVTTTYSDGTITCTFINTDTYQLNWIDT